jgi:hypothetical protein
MVDARYVEHWTHGLNSDNGKVEIRCIVEGRAYYIEFEDKDVERIYSWLQIKEFKKQTPRR